MPDGDRQFDELTREHATLMAAAIRRVCSRRHSALVPDVEQEVRLALWKRLASGNEIRHPASYIYKVALTTALAMVRKLAPEAASLDEVLERGTEPGPRGEVELEPAELALLIEEALESLETHQAQALRAWLAGFNHLEVAELFGWTESVARHRIYRGMERLRATLGERHGDA